jgi:cysteine synthase A
VTQQAEDFFRAAISNPEQPLVMFAVEWCEFSWAVRKLFAAIAVPYHAIDLKIWGQSKNSGMTPNLGKSR